MCAKLQVNFPLHLHLQHHERQFGLNVLYLLCMGTKKINQKAEQTDEFSF